MRGILSLAVFLVSLWIGSSAARAHESKPCLLNITQLSTEQYQLNWKTPPTQNGEVHPVGFALPQDWELLADRQQRSLSDGKLTSHRILIPAGSLDGSVVSFPGLEGLVTEVFVRVSRLDGTQFSAIARSTEPRVELRGERPVWQTMREFILLGTEHILHGADHLLFVLGLLLIVSGTLPLVKTITAFTLAHSITLVLAALGLASLPPGPVEVLIALSILFLGPEIVRVWRGQSSLAIRRPWLVAFIFGLLHGFGFAGGLSLAGMPQAEIPLALLSFNIGVELGQLLFVALVLVLIRLAGLLRIHWPQWLSRAPGYVVGISGAFWFLQRSYLLFGPR